MKLKITVGLLAVLACLVLAAAAGSVEIARLIDVSWGREVTPLNAGLASSLNPQGNRLVLEAQSRTQLQNEYQLTLLLEFEGPPGTRSVGTKLISSNPRLLKPGNVRITTFPWATASLELVGAELRALRQPTALNLQVIDPGGNRDLPLEIRPYQGDVYVSSIRITPPVIYPNDLVNFEIRLTDAAPSAPLVTGPLAVNTQGRNRHGPADLRIAGGLDVHWELESADCFVQSGIAYSATGLNRVHIDPGNDIARFAVRVVNEPRCIGSHLLKTWTHETRTTAAPHYVTAAFRVRQRLN